MSISNVSGDFKYLNTPRLPKKLQWNKADSSLAVHRQHLAKRIIKATGLKDSKRIRLFTSTPYKSEAHMRGIKKETEKAQDYMDWHLKRVKKVHDKIFFAQPSLKICAETADPDLDSHPDPDLPKRTKAQENRFEKKWILNPLEEHARFHECVRKPNPSYIFVRQKKEAYREEFAAAGDERPWETWDRFNRLWPIWEKRLIEMGESEPDKLYFAQKLQLLTEFQLSKPPVIPWNTLQDFLATMEKQWRTPGLSPAQLVMIREKSADAVGDPEIYARDLSKRAERDILFCVSGCVAEVAEQYVETKAEVVKLLREIEYTAAAEGLPAWLKFRPLSAVPLRVRCHLEVEPLVMVPKGDARRAGN